jgi:hypothetical protein
MFQGTDVSTYSLHPGVVASDVWRTVPWPLRSVIKLFMISPQKGAATTLHCASAAGLATETGLYYDQCRDRPPSQVAQNPSLAAELWKASEDWIR